MKAYLIPGWGESLTGPGYSEILNIYRSSGYEPQFVAIDWNYKTLSDWVKEAEAQISKRDLQNSILSGFSWGAMTALVLAANYQTPKRLLLFSLSPYFAEDIPLAKKWWLDAVGKKRLSDFKDYKVSELAKDIACPSLIFVGEREGSDVKRRARAAHQKIGDSRLIIIQNAKHDIADKRYQEAIKKALNT